MIAAYNRRQTLLAAGNFCLSLLATIVTFAFFFFGSKMTAKNFEVDLPSYFPGVLAISAVTFIMVYGIFEFRRGAGHSAFHESDLYPGFDLSFGSGYLANYRIQQVTAPAYFLSQFFLAAPLQLMEGITRLRSRIEDSHGLETQLASVLGQINATPKWHPLATYHQCATEVGYLIRMGKVQFSPNKGTVRPL